MQKNPPVYYNSLSVAATFSFIAAFVLLSLAGCKKNDLSPYRNEVDIPQKFFNGHRSVDPTEKALVEYMKRQNERLNFVEKTSAQIGYPRWNKAITIQQRNSYPTSRGENSDTAVYYIPFVRDSQNYVNASLAIKVTPSDTSFYYLCDWQYLQRQNSDTSVSDVAEHYAVFFMKFDKIVFGHKNFKINNDRLFHGNFTGPVKVRLVEDSNSNNLNSVFTCQTVVISWQDCPYPPGRCFGLNGTCDDCSYCTSSVQYQYCTEVWTDDGGGSGGGGTGGGGGAGSGGTGGGSGGGGGTPPDCGGPQGRGIAARGDLPCEEEPGWEPEPIEDDPPPSNDPCEVAQLAAKKLDTLYTNSKADTVLANIPNLATEPNEKGFSISQKLVINSQNVQDTAFTTYKISPVSTGTPNSIATNNNIPYLHVMVCWFHTHPPDAYPAQSAFDIYRLIEIKLQEEPYLVGNFAAAADGSQYGITVTNPALAAAFLNTKSVFLDTSDWKANSDIGKEFEKAYNYYSEKKYKNYDSVTQRNLSYEMAMAAVLNSFNTGVTLHKKDPATGKFKPLVVKTVIPNPNKPKKKEYVEDCL